MSTTGIIKVTYAFKNMYISLDTKLLQNDKYINRVYYRSLNFFISCAHKCNIKYQSYYFEPYKNTTINKHIKTAIIGLTLAYNDLMEDILKDQNFIYYDTHRKDIRYIEIPVHLISNYLNMSEYDVYRYVLLLCRQTDYISRHDKVYCDKINKDNKTTYEHFINESYKYMAPIKKYNDTTSQELGRYNHPVVTPLSFILHINKLENKSFYKKYIEPMQKRNQYQSIIVFLLTSLKNANYKYSDDALANINSYDKGVHILAAPESVFATNFNRREQDNAYDAMRNSSQIIDLDIIHSRKQKINKQIRISEKTLLKINNIESAISVTKHILSQMSDTEYDEVNDKHNMKMIDIISNRVKSYLQNIKQNKPCEYDKLVTKYSSLDSTEYNKLNTASIFSLLAFN